MVNPLDSVLHARYQGPRIDRGTNNYGDQELGTPCPPPLIDGKMEAINTSHVIDVSRGTFHYFNNSIFLGGRTLAGPTTGGGMAGINEDSNVNKQVINRVASFINKTYALISSGIYEYDDAIGGAVSGWSTSLDLSDKDEGVSASIGLYPVFVENTPYLITAYRVGLTGNWRSARLNGLTGQWSRGTATSVDAPNDGNGGIHTECQHKGRIYFLNSSSTNIQWYDYEKDTFGSVAFPSTVRYPMDFCPFMGDLFLINKDDSGTVKLWRIDATSTPIEVAEFTRQGSYTWGQQNETLTTTDQYEGRPLLFVDNVYDSKVNSKTPVMYASYICHSAFASPDEPTDSNHGLHHVPYRHDGSGGLVSQEVPGAGQALGFRANPFKCNQNQEAEISPFGGVASRKDERIVLRVFVDQKTRDSSLADKTAIVIGSRFSGQLCTDSPGGGGDFTNHFYHRFVGSGNGQGDAGMPERSTRGGGPHSMEYIGMPKKGVRHRASPHERHGGGARHHVLDNNNNRIADIVFRGMETVGSSLRIKYNIVPSTANPSGSLVAVRWFYDENQHAPEDPCTLVATSHGALSGNYTAASVPVIDDSTIYTVDWDANSDEVRRGAFTKLNGMVVLAGGAFGPISTPSGVDGLLAWFEADDATTITSGVTNQVSVWNNKVPTSGAISGVVQSSGVWQPLLVESANNGLAGVRFRSVNEEFLFANESPISSNDPSTIMIIYEPNTLNSIDTMFSLSQDTPVSGSITDVEFVNASVTSAEAALLETLDLTRLTIGSGVRQMTLPSGGETGKARLLVWTETAFEAESYVYPSDATAFTDIITDGIVESSGLQNTTFGRYSGAAVLGDYTGAGQYFDGTIYEIAVYDNILSSIDIDRFRQYAVAKYTLTV